MAHINIFMETLNRRLLRKINTLIMVSIMNNEWQQRKYTWDFLELFGSAYWI